MSASQIADRIPELPDLPVDVGEMTDRLRGLTEAAATTAREAANSARQAAGGRPSDKRGLTLPLLAGLGALGVLIAVVLMLRSRRTTTDVGSTAPTGTPAHT
ncbi:MAG TPA: hypothetical protein VFH58_08170 [Acidimicrobiales bacterium]|nr:hypothetical protein [Acidimicrobiales bacterium]